jgi:membrane-bound metal-dependent hydrolase YbcI (DUF457 family)
MLPDIDSDSGRPLHESMAFASAVVPMMLVDRLVKFNLSTETIVLTGAIAYLVIRFGIAELIKKLTVHRGMFHSLPAAIIFGEIAFLLASGDNVYLRGYKAGAVTLGYLSHLVLDELYSFGIRRGRVRLKESFGTAVKFFGPGVFPNLATYAALALLTTVALKEPGWMRTVYDQYGRRGVEYVSGAVQPDSEKAAHPGTLLDALRTPPSDPPSPWK